MTVDRGRVRATWLLAESCLDHLPQARQPSSTLGTLPGLAPSRFVPCTACAARGRVFEPGKQCIHCPPLTNPVGDRKPAFNRRHGCHPCPACDGTGWRPRRRHDPEVDGYAGVEVPPREDAGDISVGAIRKAVQAERERPEIGHQALARATRAVDLAERPDAAKLRWEEQWDRMCAHGSYAELTVALELLRTREQPRYSAVWHLVCCQEPVTLSPARQAFLNESMAVLASLMPERIRVPWWLREDKRAKAAKSSLWRGRSPAHLRERRERDMEVLRLHVEEGVPRAQLQRRFALSKSQVNRILADWRERSHT